MDVTRDVKRAANKAAINPVVETLTRIGYGVRGMIYIIIGILAIQVALGKGGALTGPQGAIAAIGRQPAGLVLLWITLVGVLSYALWGVIRAVLDPLHKGHDLKGILTRIGYLVSAFSYAALAYPTYGYIKGSSSGGGASNQKLFTTIMAMPWGRWAIGLLGLIGLAAGIYQIYLGFKAGFDRQFTIYALSAEEVKMITNIGRFGTAARGLVFAIVGGLIALGAYRANPGQPIGIDAALATLRHQSYGVWLLGIVALGLVAFGIYSMLSAFWFRLRR